MRAELEATELTVELMRSSRLDDSDLRAGPRDGTQGLRDGRDAGPTAVELGRVDPPGLDIDAVLRARTSVRFYAPRPVARGEIAAVLQAAGGLDSTLYPDEVTAGLGLELLVAARRVEGVPPALYQSLEDGRALEHTGVLPTGADADQLVLQREYAHAPALILVLGDLAAAEARHGAHGHRLLLQRAGAVAHAGWLAAIAHGLQGSVFAGLLPGPLRQLAGVDGHRRTQLFALSIGHPPVAGTTVEPKEKT